MKRYIKENIILIIQLFMFYIFPLFAGPTDAMGMVILILLSTFILSIIIGAISKEKLSYYYPLIVSIVFIHQFQSPDSSHPPHSPLINMFVLYICISISAL